MKTINLDHWPRRSHYEFFRAVSQPHFSLTAQLDVTHLAETLKVLPGSTFNAVLFAIMGAVHATPELRTRFRDDQVVLHDTVHASVTVPIEKERFGFCNIEYAADWAEFDQNCRAAVEQAQRQSALEDTIAHRDDWVYLSCLPWVTFTAMTNPVGGPHDCIPRITWGRYEQHDEAWRMPVAIQVHHALVDGYHVGEFYRELQQHLDSYPR